VSSIVPSIVRLPAVVASAGLPLEPPPHPKNDGDDDDEDDCDSGGLLLFFRAKPSRGSNNLYRDPDAVTTIDCRVAASGFWIGDVVMTSPSSIDGWFRTVPMTLPFGMIFHLSNVVTPSRVDDDDLILNIDAATWDDDDDGNICM
jgi:hypothetical protein